MASRSKKPWLSRSAAAAGAAALALVFWVLAGLPSRDEVRVLGTILRE